MIRKNLIAKNYVQVESRKALCSWMSFDDRAISKFAWMVVDHSLECLQLKDFYDCFQTIREDVVRCLIGGNYKFYFAIANACD